MVSTLFTQTVELAVNRIKGATSCASTIGRVALPFVVLVIATSTPAAAQESGAGSELCGTLIVEFLDGLMTLLAGLAPMLGAVVAMISMVALTQTIDPEKQRDWRQRRNDAIKYGVGTLFIGAVFKILLNLTGLELAKCISISPF